MFKYIIEKFIILESCIENSAHLYFSYNQPEKCKLDFFYKYGKSVKLFLLILCKIIYYKKTQTINE